MKTWDEAHTADSLAPPTCWRCGKVADPERPICAYCRAVLVRSLAEADSASLAIASSHAPIVRLIWVFVALLVTSIAYGWMIQFGMNPALFAGPEGMENWLRITLVVEFIDTLLVLAALVWIARPPSLPRRSGSSQVTTWLVAWPALLLLFGLNFAYHWSLQRFINAPDWLGDAMIQEKFSMLALLVGCVQPAVVEELFFRYLALGTLRRSMGVHGAVLVSAVMFAMAHIFSPVSMPIFFVIGAALGYIRVASGSLMLPILLHFSHNALVLLLETFQ